jgi:hypothetical protein
VLAGTHSAAGNECSLNLLSEANLHGGTPKNAIAQKQNQITLG